jgi:hypothetical protein
MSAVMSQSTAGFRHLLSENDIPFEPFLKASNQEESIMIPGFEFIEESDLKQDNLSNTGLEFKTTKSTHLLYNFLLNWVEPQFEVRALGPPKLICDSPFLNGTLSPPSVSQPTPISRSSEKVYKTVLKGMILPKVIREILQNAQDGCEVYMETVPVSISKCKPTTISTIEFRDKKYYIKYIR